MDEHPVISGLVFTKTDKNTYVAHIKNTKTGFQSILYATYAINRQNEFDSLGSNSDFSESILSSGGKIFKPTDVESIIEYVKNVSKRTVVEQVSFQFEFIFTALIIVVLEMIVRRVYQNWR